MTKFVNVGSISVDHIDPSIFCVLTAKSRDSTAPLADLLIFSPRWDVASRTYHAHRTVASCNLANTNITDTYRPPYYHRNAASELMGLIYGDYGGRSDAFKPGSVSFECGSRQPLPLPSPHSVNKITQANETHPTSGPSRRRLRGIQSRH